MVNPNIDRNDPEPDPAPEAPAGGEPKPAGE